MAPRSSLTPRTAGIALATVASLAVAGLAAGASYAAPTGGAGASPPSVATRTLHPASAADPEIDATAGSISAATQATGKALQSLGSSPTATTVLELGGTTGTVRFHADLDGYLTDRSTDRPERIALDYVRANAELLGLRADDVATFRLHRDYRDIEGTHHLSFTQHVAGTTVARNGLTAAVTRDGRLLMVGGMPLRGTSTAELPSTRHAQVTTPGQALALTRGRLAAGADTTDDAAQRVVLDTPSGLRPAWETVDTSSETPAVTVVDAVTGDVLLRTPLTHHENSTGRAFRYFPGAQHGGRQVEVDFTDRGWLGPHADRLKGNNAHAYSDVDDDNRASASEEVRPRTGQSWGYRLQRFDLPWARSFCDNPWPCSWNPDKPYSWRANRAQNTTQVFVYVNTWHDHLKRAPIGFTEAAGNFQLRNHTGHGLGGDPVKTQTDDGADTGTGRLKGLPDDAHVNNADMATPPDGHRPTMQMYLQHRPFESYPKGDPWSPTNIGDEADTVYHEYTHGLSSRLVVDVRGRETLGPVQGDSMGEGWSDWYAMSYLADQGLLPDRSGVADVLLSVYDGVAVSDDRTEAMDCKVGQTDRLCRGGKSGHGGGYTYADFGRVIGEPEVHADGEIWGQTLWDLRDAVGSRVAQSLVTRAMELAPADPSYLDMRNAMLLADTAVHDGQFHDAVWKVFANRGMGFYAGSLTGSDAEPAASTALPPATLRTGTIQGTVRSDDSGRPLANLRVTLAFQGAGVVNPTAVTDRSGHYTIAGVPVGDYGKLVVRGGGITDQRPVTVDEGTTTADFTPDLG